MAHYQEHPSKVTAWRNGRFVLSPSLGADGTVAVQSVPFFVYDIALGDEVSTVASAEGPLVAVEPTRRSGMLTFRVLFDGEDDDPWQHLMRDLERWACWFDVRSARFVAIAAPSEHAQAVADYLHGREHRGELQYETGRTT